MRSLVLVAVMAIGSLASADLHVGADRVQDGKASLCRFDDHIGNMGYTLRDMQVSRNADNELEVSFSPRFVRCVRTADALQWVEISSTEFHTWEVETANGPVRFEAVNPEWIVYTTEDFEKQGRGGDNAKIVVKEKLDKLLKGDQKDRYDNNEDAFIRLTVFEKADVKAYLADGSVVNVGSRASGSYIVTVRISRDRAPSFQ